MTTKSVAQRRQLIQELERIRSRIRQHHTLVASTMLTDLLDELHQECPRTCPK